MVFWSRGIVVAQSSDHTRLFLAMASPLLPILGVHLPLYAGYFVYLTINVIRYRRSVRISLGDGSAECAAAESADNKERAKQISGLTRAVRSHANFTEYVPMALIVLGALELNAGVSQRTLAILHRILLAARILHAEFGLLRGRQAVGFGRPLGLVVTLSVLGYAAVMNGMTTLKWW